MKVEYVDHMGSDLSVANAARVSFSKWKDALDASDAKLIKYLAKHNHWTPFAHTAISLRMTAPVPIRTQCFKTKAGMVENEESRRYISTRPELFVPEFRSRPEGSIKQGSGGLHPISNLWRDSYSSICNEAIDMYEAMIDDGIAPEQARFVLPQGVEVSWIWTGSLAAYARFCGLRSAGDAQGEVQQLAAMVGDIIRPLFPVSWEALTAPR